MLKKIYQSSPVWMQNIACSFKGLLEKRKRMGGEFNQLYDELKKTQWMSKDEIEKYQIDKLQYMVKYCYENIPYYKELFDRHEINSLEIKSLRDIERIPVLTKDLVRENIDKLQNPNFKGKVIHAHTSGSTGKALKFNMSKYAIEFRWALWFRHKSRFGTKPLDAYATFTGLVVVPITQEKPPYWRENFPMKQTIFTMHHINKEKVPAIVERLNRGGFAYYSGYPSILFSLASIIEELNLKIMHSPHVIFTGAETLLDHQREKISKVFGCLVTDQYGFSEGCGNASRCEHDLFHEDFEYGILECHNPIMNSDGSRTGEVLATGFTNLAMPFLRYQVGDTATWGETKCDCGRHSKTLFQINGRNEDFVITPEGNKILRFDYIFKDTVNVLEAQIIQKELGSIIIMIVRGANYSERDENLLAKEVRSKISPLLEVKFEYVEEIAREATGKFRAVKSYLSKN